MRWLVIGAIAVVGLLAPSISKLGLFGYSNPFEAKARRDDGVMVAEDDPAMRAALEKGRATLDGFLAVNANRPANAQAFALKVRVQDSGKVEWFWIAEFERDGDGFLGTIDNTPRSVGNVRQGQRIAFPRGDIGDWMYVQDGRMKGNFSACALLAKEEPKAREDFMRKFGMDCSA